MHFGVWGPGSRGPTCRRLGFRVLLFGYADMMFEFLASLDEPFFLIFFDEYQKLLWKQKRLLTLWSADLTKWSNTLKQFVGKLPTNCLSMFDHFVGLAFTELINIPEWKVIKKNRWIINADRYQIKKWNNHCESRIFIVI